VREAASIPRVLGLKDGSGNLLYLQKLCAATARYAEFSLLVGPEELLGSAILAGAHGGVNGGTNLFPGLYVQLYEAAARRDLTRMLALQRLVMQVSDGLYTCGVGASSLPVWFEMRAVPGGSLCRRHG
jgi:4-hydroxy-tetrahydrodipicolinate synthase